MVVVMVMSGLMIVVMVPALVMMMVVPAVMVVMDMLVFAPNIAFAVYANVLRPAAAYLAHGYLPLLVVEGLLAEGSPA